MTSFHPEGVEDYLVVLASTTQPQEEGMPSSVRVQIPRSQAYFTGTGTSPSCALSVVPPWGVTAPPCTGTACTLRRWPGRALHKALPESEQECLLSRTSASTVDFEGSSASSRASVRDPPALIE